MGFGFIPVKTALSELKTLSLYRDTVCEAVVMFFLVFFVVIVGTPVDPNSRVDITGIGLVGGLIVFVLIEAFGHIQWSVMNPMVCLSFVCTKRISFIKGIFYLGAQLGGGTAAAVLAVACTPPNVQPHINPFGPGLDVTPLQAIVVEAVLVAALIFTCLGALDEDNRKVTMPGLPIGMCIALGIIAGAKYSGAGINCAIAFSIAASRNNWDDLYIYWVGDLIGGVIAIVVYHLFTYQGRPCAPPDTEQLKDVELDCKDPETDMKLFSESLLSKSDRDNRPV